MFLRVLISNIKLAVQNMSNYVNRIAITLPEDRKKDDKKNAHAQASLDKQLEDVFSHIEDLEKVNKRITQEDNTAHYADALPSQKDTIRIEN